MACPKETAIRKAARASFELSGITLDVVKAVGKAYDERIISLATKDKLAGHLKLVISGGKKFNQSIEGLNALTTAQASVLNTIFSDEIVTPFLAILEEVRALTPAQADHVRTAIAALRAAILIISGTFADAGFPDARLKSYA